MFQVYCILCWSLIGPAFFKKITSAFKVNISLHVCLIFVFKTFTCTACIEAF